MMKRFLLEIYEIWFIVGVALDQLKTFYLESNRYILPRNVRKVQKLLTMALKSWPFQYQKIIYATFIQTMQIMRHK